MAASSLVQPLNEMFEPRPEACRGAERLSPLPGSSSHPMSLLRRHWLALIPPEKRSGTIPFGSQVTGNKE